MIPLWIKVSYVVFLCAFVPVYAYHNGLANFLWASDIAVFLVFVSVWSERPLANSMMAIGVLPFEILWIVDFASGSRLIGMAAHMFEPANPLYLRALSLFHVLLPPLMIFLLCRLGYDSRALPAQILLTWIVLPVTYLASDPAANINLAFGLGRQPQTELHPLLYLGAQMVLVPLVTCWPCHLLLQRVLGSTARRT